MGDVIQLEFALGRNDTAMALLPQVCAAEPVGCSDLSVNPTYLPLHGQPAFQALVIKYDTTTQPPASAASSAPSSP